MDSFPINPLREAMKSLSTNAKARMEPTDYLEMLFNEQIAVLVNVLAEKYGLDTNLFYDRLTARISELNEEVKKRPIK